MTVTLEVTNGVATITLDRPRKRNALNEDMLTALVDRVRAVRADPDARAVVITSSSDTFCAGADISDWADPAPDDARRLTLLGHAVCTGLAELPQPSVAVMRGAAMGGGLELALACDLRVAANDARLAFPETRLGNLPSWGGVPRLVDTVGHARARQMVLTGTVVDGATAARWGLVSLSADPSDLQDTAAAVVADILQCDPTALRLMKSVLPPTARVNPELDAAFAVHTGALPSSRERKQAFLTRR